MILMVIFTYAIMWATLTEADNIGGIAMKLNREELCHEARNVLEKINDGEFPEVYEYLDGILIDEDVVTASPYEIAAALGRCDNPKPFPPFLVDFITDLFDCEIAEGNTDAMCELGGYYYDGGRGA